MIHSGLLLYPCHDALAKELRIVVAIELRAEDNESSPPLFSCH
jgi:hypothetical protein